MRVQNIPDSESNHAVRVYDLIMARLPGAVCWRKNTAEDDQFTSFQGVDMGGALVTRSNVFCVT